MFSTIALKSKPHYLRVKELYLRYERWLMPAMLVGGFLIDYFTFSNINISTAFTILLIYWCLAGLTISFIHFYDAGKLSQKSRYIRLFSPLLIQFTFGALLGGSLIFYWFSGSLAVSWPLILIIAILMVSNDVFRRHFLKPLVQVSVYFFITFSLASVILPFLFNSLSAELFLLAGGVSLVVILLYIKLLTAIHGQFKEQKTYLHMAVTAIFLLMNFFYFANVIPPIPLSLREAGVYHSIQRSGNLYVLQGEYESFWQKIVPGQTVHIALGEQIYLYTAIFAPLDLKTTIYHHWQYRDENSGDWISRDRLSFEIVGGRREGYRGYSWKSNLTPGRWRVFVETERGQVLATVNFKVQKADQPVELKRIVR